MAHMSDEMGPLTCQNSDIGEISALSARRPHERSRAATESREIKQQIIRVAIANIVSALEIGIARCERRTSISS